MAAGLDTVRYGVIGTGMMGVEHIRNINAIQGAVVTAIADPHEPSRSDGVAAADSSGDVVAYADHRDLLTSGRCDAVVVASPNMTHIDVLRDALRTDLHVLVEKPLCTTVADCKEVAGLAEDRAALVWVGLEYRYMAPVARLVDEVRAGAAGELQMLAIREHRFPFLRKVGDWNRFNRNTGGTLVEKCCHFFDLMCLIMGDRPEAVLASGGQNVNHLDERYDGAGPDILDNAYVIVEFSRGRRALLDLCMFAEATKNQEEIAAVGDKGKVEALIPDDVVRIGRRGQHSHGSTTPRVRASGRSRSTARPPASSGRPRCVTTPTTRATSNAISGPVSVGPAAVRVPPSWAIPIRSRARSGSSRRWESTRSSSPATPTSRNAISLLATCCRHSTTPRSRSIPRP